MKRVLTVIAISVILLSGCISTGTKVNDKSVSSFVKGETSASDVRIALGEPEGITFNSEGEQTFTYSFIDTDVKAATYIPIVGLFAGGATSKVESLIVTFDKNGILKDWIKNNTTSDFSY
jgi:outer membrane protein assembly factor BamE (lipoprotein component of BamABCDE complex)